MHKGTFFSKLFYLIHAYNSTLNKGRSTVIDRRNSACDSRKAVLNALLKLYSATVILFNRQATQTKSMTIILNRQVGIPRRSVII